MSDDGGATPSDRMEERGAQSRWKLRLLMDVNRWLLAGAFAGLVFGSMVVLGVADPSPLQAAIAASDPVDTLFNGFIGAIITGVTLVVTLNQLVLSQELGPLGDQRERMEGAMRFREDVESTIETDTSPPAPASFLSALLDGVQSRANRLATAVEDSRDAGFREQVDQYTDSLTENAKEVGDQLGDAQFGRFSVLSAALNFNYSWKIYEARRLKNENEDALTEEADEAFDDLIEVLQFFGPAREHVKTLYFQWELVNLSRAMVYAALPALVVASAMIVYFDARALPGETLSISNDVLAVSLATTVASLPFIILVAYILRIATVAKQTLAIGPFILRTAGRSDDVDWDR